MHLNTLTEAFQPVKKSLIGPLTRAFRKHKSSDQRYVAALLLADYAAERTELLADLALDAEARQFQAILPTHKSRAEPVRVLMRAELAKAAPAKATEAEKVHDATVSQTTLREFVAILAARDSAEQVTVVDVPVRHRGAPVGSVVPLYVIG